MDFLKQTINVLADILVALIFIRIILSWFNTDRSSFLMRFLHESTEPILKPIRRALPRTGMFDLSPIIAFLLIELSRSILIGIL